MPLRTVKKDTADAQTLEWVLHVQNYKLTLDKNRCEGCQICSLACPKEAIQTQRQPKRQGEKAKKAKVDLDLKKCNFCGICDLACPYGAIKVTLNGKHLLNVVEKKSFPQLIRDVQVNPDKYLPVHGKNEKPCPLDLIKITMLTPDGKPKESFAIGEGEKPVPKARIDVDLEHCPCCGICEVNLPRGVMQVRKFLNGKININSDKCPENCTDCLDVCPITGTLYVSDADKKVHVNEAFCIYCGACKVVCPVHEALEVKRISIRHMPVHSGAWNKALERLTSPVEMVRELKTTGSHKARESVRKRVGLRGEENA